MYQIYIFFTFYPCKEVSWNYVFLNTKFCHKTLDGAVRSSNSILHNDIIIYVAQLIVFSSHQQPMSLLLNVQTLG